MVVGAVAVQASSFSYVLAIVFRPMISAAVGGPRCSFTWLSYCWTGLRTSPVVGQQERQLVIDDFVTFAQLHVQRGCPGGGIGTVLLHQHDNGAMVGPPSGEDGDKAEKRQQFHDDLFLVRRCNVDFG
jgi:hypothetical protein